uniref:Uncharacterized protein n=1 Tax=Salix viminalis TaxID=40686 RepID=A0A6N2L3B8_SALVM
MQDFSVELIARTPKTKSKCPHNRPLSTLKPTFVFAPCRRINNNCTGRFEVGFLGQQNSRRRSNNKGSSSIHASSEPSRRLRLNSHWFIRNCKTTILRPRHSLA